MRNVGIVVSVRVQILTAAIVALATMTVSRRGGAQSAADSQQTAARRGLLTDAQTASAANDHARALDLALRAAAIEMTPSVRAFIATEQIALGRLADAFGSADLCMRDAERDSALRNRDAIIATCRGIVGRVGPQLGRVVVRLPSIAPQGVSVRVAGTPLNAAFYGVPYRVTPGNVVVEATAQDRAPFRREVPVPAGASVSVDVVFEAAAAGRLSPALRGGTGSPRSAASSGGGSAGPAIVMTLGGAALATSAVFYVLRFTSIAALGRYCDMGAMGYTCDALPEAMATYSRAQFFDVAAPIVLGAGAATFVGGFAWWLLARGGRREAGSSHLQVIPTLGAGALIQVGGSL